MAANVHTLCAEESVQQEHSLQVHAYPLAPDMEIAHCHQRKDQNKNNAITLRNVSCMNDYYDCRDLRLCTAFYCQFAVAVHSFVQHITSDQLDG